MFKGHCVQQVRLGFALPPSAWVCASVSLPKPQKLLSLKTLSRTYSKKDSVEVILPTQQNFHSFSHLKGKEIIFLSFNMVPEGIWDFFPPSVPY